MIIKKGVNMIAFDDFSKLELKIGIVIEAEDHPNADKLLVLKVDLGEEQPRQLVAGIRNNYSADELKGKQIVVLANLEPRMLRGVESQGMLLAARGKEKVVLLSPEKEVEPGSTIG